MGLKNKKSDVHHACIACITIDSVMRIEKKNYQQADLEECKYEINKMYEFIDAKIRF